jgi:tRNA G18 (ribose-2'-O)-methylase SpoU
MSRITLVLHNIRSTHNVGAIFRTAEGFGVEEIILSGYTPYPSLGKLDTRLPHIAEKLTQQIHKTALGAETIVPFRFFAEFDDWQKNTEIPLIALEQSPKSTLLSDYQPPETFALLLGEEVAGIATDILTACDDIVEIPMQGQKESFNVSVACGIALYALTTTL